MSDRSDADEPIKIASYDPAWPSRFTTERQALSEAIGRWITGGIHHIGSTAVPGLPAKPIIDILAGVEGLQAPRPSFEPLAALDYLYAPYRADEMHWFCKPDPSRRTHHLHLVPTDSSRFRNELPLRDCLRASPPARERIRSLEARSCEPLRARPGGLHRRQGCVRPPCAGARVAPYMPNSAAGDVGAGDAGGGSAIGAGSGVDSTIGSGPASATGADSGSGAACS